LSHRSVSRQLTSSVSVPSRVWRLAAFVAVSLAVVGAQVYAVFFAEHGVPRSGRTGRAMLVGEVAGDHEVSQTMALEADGFERIVVHARPYGGSVGGDVVFELKDIVGGTEGLLFRISRSAAEVIASNAFAIAFPPINNSSGRQYRLDISAPRTPPGQGIALAATSDDSYPGGSLFVDGRERWGDLVFETQAARDTMYRTVEHLLRESQAGVALSWLLGGLFVAYNAALVVFVYYMLFRGEAEA